MKPTFEVDGDGIHFWFIHECLWGTDRSLMPHSGGTWHITQAEPLTVEPSIHCSKDLGGCGTHGWIRGGVWCAA